MRRREFIGVMGGVAAMSPLVALAQQVGRKRLVGVVAGFSAAEMRPLLAANFVNWAGPKAII